MRAVNPVDALAVALPLVTAGLYWTGVTRLWRHAGRGAVVRGWQVCAFGWGTVIATAALAAPLEAAAARSLSAHMVQHLLLVLLTAPLVVLGAPALPLVWALPSRWRNRARGWRLPVAARRWLSRGGGAAAACLMHVGALWLWHVPTLYSAAVDSSAVHAVQHGAIVGTALLLWTHVFSSGGPVRRPAPVAALAMFGAATLTVGLAALLVIAPAPLYAVYVAAAPAVDAALEDQRIAGALMWAAGGLVYTVAGATALGLWIHRAQSDTAIRDGAPTP